MITSVGAFSSWLCKAFTFKVSALMLSLNESHRQSMSPAEVRALQATCFVILLIGSVLWIRWHRLAGRWTPALPSTPDSLIETSEPNKKVDLYTWRTWHDAAAALEGPTRRLSNGSLVISLLILAVPGLLILNSTLKLAVLIYAPLLAYLVQQLVTHRYSDTQFAKCAREMREMLVPDILTKVHDRELLILAINASATVGPLEVHPTSVGSEVTVGARELARQRRGPIWYQG